ncbi:MAG: peptidylprolyl isomerase, partial [candidate division Zixibacteria bacterium]
FFGTRIFLDSINLKETVPEGIRVMFSRYGKTVFLLITAVLMLLQAGCSTNGDDVLAVVGDHEITLTEYQDFLGNYQGQFASAQAEHDFTMQILDSLVIKRLLINAAYDMGIDKTDQLTRLVLANQNQFLLDILFQRNVVDKAVVTDEEVRKVWGMLEFKIRASHILVDNEDTAKALLERVLAGENFGQLAFDYSIDPSAQRNRGDLGFFTYGAMVPEFQDVAFALEPGEIAPPVKSDYGYHLIKLVDKTPNPGRVPFEQMRAELRKHLIDQSRKTLTQSYVKSLEEKFPITVDPATMDYLIHKRAQLYPPQLLATLPQKDFDDEQLDRNERELVVATWNGGQMTLYEYLVQSRRVPEGGRPDFDDSEGIASFIFQMKANDLLVLEATRLGLQDDPVYQRRIGFYRELTMADLYVSDSMPKPPDPPENTIRMYYEKHASEFTDQAKVRIFEILVSDENLARKLAREIKTLDQFKQKASELTERPGKRELSGDMDYIEKSYHPDLFEAAWSTSIDKMGGPIATGGRYSVYWVVDKVSAALKDYLGVKRSIINKLTAETKVEAFGQWIADAKDGAGVKLYPEAAWVAIDTSIYAVFDTTGTASN